ISRADYNLRAPCIERFDSQQVIILFVVGDLGDAFQINHRSGMNELRFYISLVNVAKKAFGSRSGRWVAEEKLLPLRVVSSPEISGCRFAAAASRLDKCHPGLRFPNRFLKSARLLPFQPRA